MNSANPQGEGPDSFKVDDIDEFTPSQSAAFTTLSRFIRGQGDTDAYVLAGYAGTGKTWLLVKLLNLALDQGIKVAVCAPTHKAVSVIRQKIEFEGIGKASRCSTLHALIGLKLKEGRFGEYRIHYDRLPGKDYFEDFELVFIDETSMVGKPLLKEIQQAQNQGGTRVLYFGDRGQLLPVEDKPATPELQSGDLLDGVTANLPPVFHTIQAQCRLHEIVRQKSTGRPHPVAAFAEVIRGYIEGTTEGVLTPRKIQTYVEAHRHELDGRVRLGRAQDVSPMIVGLRKARPLHDIRGIAWRNRLVDHHNESIHRQLDTLYEVSEAHRQDPFWVGETLIAREMLYIFPGGSHPESYHDDLWEDLLAPSSTPDDTSRHAGRKSRKNKSSKTRTSTIQNNTELRVERCDALQHPYLHIPCWRVRARPAGEDPVEFFVAGDANEHRRLTREAWAAYRSCSNQGKKARAFRRAWTITRACAPVMHAYAMTAHKSQGSTFDCAIVDVPDLYASVYKMGADDYHRALYVAVTRASEAVWLCV